MSFLNPMCTLEVNGGTWSPWLLDKAVEILRRERLLYVAGLAGDDRIHCFSCENALREWSEELLSSSPLKH